MPKKDYEAILNGNQEKYHNSRANIWLVSAEDGPPGIHEFILTAEVAVFLNEALGLG